MPFYLLRFTTNRLLEDVAEKAFLKTCKNLDVEKALVTDKLEKSRERLKDLDNRYKWLDGITRYLDHLEKMETETDEQKKHFLSLFIERIDVSYDAKTKEHTLLIKFRLPIVDDDDFGDGDIRVGGFDKRAILPPFKATPQSWSRFQRGSSQIGNSLIFAMKLKSSSFWISPYSDHQEFLCRIIIRLRSENMTFAQISEWLNKRNYETPRGKAFGPNHVFSIYKKKRLRDKRLMGPENPMIRHI